MKSIDVKKDGFIDASWKFSSHKFVRFSWRWVASAEKFEFQEWSKNESKITTLILSPWLYSETSTGKIE